MATPERLTQDELAVVLRRAAELDVVTLDGDEPGMPLAAVEAAAAEVGLAPEAVRQAVAELRAGLLARPDEDERGADIVVVARLVPFEVDRALDAADRFLVDKVLERVRDRGAARSYRRRDDWFAGMTRTLDFGGSTKKLAAVSEVEVRAVAVEGGTLLRLTARLKRGLVLGPRIAGIGAAVVVGGLAGAGLATQFEPDLVFAALGIPVGAAAGVGGWGAANGRLLHERQRTTECLDGFLDELELGRQPHERSALARLRSRARSLRGPWA